MQKDYSEMDYHPLTEKLAVAIHKKIPTAPMHMLRTVLVYYMCKVASTMRTMVETEIRGTIPVNAFTFNLAPSGTGKNYSLNIVEKEVIGQFKKVFLEQVLPIVADQTMAKIAVKRAHAENEDPDVMKQGVVNQYVALGQMRFAFQKATQPALQQLRQKLLLAGAGSMNLEIDELGLNLTASNEAITQYLELYDVGEAKENLTKNTKENTRLEELEGTTPANMLAIGTPCKVFDGGKIEENFNELNGTGLSRRSFHAYCSSAVPDISMTAEEMYDLQASKELDQVFKDATSLFAKLANVAMFGRKVILTKKVGIELLDYQRDCKKRAIPFVDTEEMIRAEMEHRYFKVLKLAGAYAFIDGHAEITMENLHAAIRYAEDSGKAFYEMTHQEGPYAKIARYIAVIPHEVTQPELSEALPYYKGSAATKREMMSYAISWGYKNHIVIKEYLRDGVQFFKGSTLKKTDITKLKLAHSAQITEGYKNDLAPFNKLHLLTQLKDHHWINHRTTNGYRDEDHMVPGFNMVVLDIDEGIKLETVHELLQDYKFMTHTTKRHTPDKHRFRLLMPLNYEMSMAPDEYREFMRNIFEWLPFDVDTGAIDRCRKWLTNDVGQYHYSQGETLLDARLFVPKTKKNDERKQMMLDYASLTNLERWFISHTLEGNRNKQLHRYARVLVDLGYDFETIKAKVLGLNSSLPDKITEDEINRTVMVTVTKALAKRIPPQTFAA